MMEQQIGITKDVDRPKIHYGPPLAADQVTFMYTYYSILNMLFRKTLTPRDGNPSDISAHAKNIMSRMQPDPRDGDFSVGDFIWEEIKHILETPLKTCGYAPYIMRVILKVTRRNWYKYAVLSRGTQHQ